MPEYLLGTSGWSYKEWVGPFYSIEDKSMLKAYARVFKTVEIDSTFYRYPSRGMVMGWARYSPEGFVFTAKLPKLITHTKKLNLDQGVEEDLQRFIDLMEPLLLSGKLDCILIQLPPKFDYKPTEIEKFFKVLPTHVRFAVEFRDKSWMRQETWTMLEKYKVVYAIVDEPLLPPEMHVTSDLAYLRWHGHGIRPWYNYDYAVEKLKQWVPRVQETAKKAEKVLGYFNNHYHGYAVKNCLQMLDLLGVQTPQQSTAKKKVENYFKSLAGTKESKLEAFAEPKTTSFEELLRYFIAAGRLERAQNIEDSALRITKQTDERVEAELKEYHIIIDVQDRRLLHDCADWGKILSTKKVCKHIGKLLLAIDREKATEIMRKMYAEKEKWQFEPYVARPTTAKNKSLRIGGKTVGKEV